MARRDAAKKDERLHLRMTKALKQKVVAYCQKYNVDMSDLATAFFTRIVQNEERRQKGHKDEHDKAANAHHRSTREHGR